LICTTEIHDQRRAALVLACAIILFLVSLQSSPRRWGIEQETPGKTGLRSHCSRISSPQIPAWKTCAIIMASCRGYTARRLRRGRAGAPRETSWPSMRRPRTSGGPEGEPPENGSPPSFWGGRACVASISGQDA
jgi:hypothetical protein